MPIEEKKKKRSLNKVASINEGSSENGEVSQEESENARGAIFDIEEEMDMIGNSMDSDTKQALSFFLPQVIAGLGAGLMEGTDAALTASDIAAKNQQALFEQQLAQQKLLQQQQESGLGAERLKLSEKNYLARLEELEHTKDESRRRELERDLKRDDKDRDRVNSVKENFMKRSDIKTYLESKDQLTAIETLVSQGKKLPSASLALIARSVSGERGVLNESDIARAQINKDVLSRLRRNATEFFTGEMPEADRKEILKIVNAIKKKNDAKVAKKTTGYVKSRSKTLHNKQYANEMEEDLLNELGTMSNKNVTTKDIDNMSKEELKRFLGE